MLVYRRTVFGVFLAAVIVAVYVRGTMTGSVEAFDAVQWEKRCLLAGTWITDPANAELVNRVIAIPLDPMNNRVSIIANVPQQDPTNGGWFPTITRGTDYVGEAVRTSANTFAVTLVAHGINESNVAFPEQFSFERVVTVVLSGEIELIGCETLQSTIWSSVYAPYQDPFGDEPPAFGCLGPFYNTRQRIVPGEPCGQ